MSLDEKHVGKRNTFDDEEHEDEESSSSEEPDHELVEEHALLRDAILSAPQSILQDVINLILNEIPESTQIVTGKLLASTTNGTKRKAHELCINCGKDYDVAGNSAKRCKYHSGSKNVDDESSTWDDHDVMCFGDPWSSELINEPDYAGGYIWTCCHGQGDAEGCVVTRHKASPSSNKRAKI